MQVCLQCEVSVLIRRWVYELSRPFIIYTLMLRSQFVVYVADLEKLHVLKAEAKHPAVGKRVHVVNGPNALIRGYKGQSGDIVAYNAALNTFMVRLTSGFTITCSPEHLCYLILS